jgi:hypothetical protein
MAQTPVFSNDTSGIYKTIVNSNSTNWIDLVDNTAGTKAIRIESLFALSDEESPTNHVVQLSLYIGTVNYLIGSVNIISLSGTNGTAPRINILNTLGEIDRDAMYVIWVPAGSKIQVKSLTQITIAKTLTLIGRYRTYV